MLAHTRLVNYWNLAQFLPATPDPRAVHVSGKRPAGLKHVLANTGNSHQITSPLKAV